jgi:hypothetical protein
LQAEWQAPSATTNLIWNAGVDPSFWICVCALFAVSAGAFYAYFRLAAAARASRL